MKSAESEKESKLVNEFISFEERYNNVIILIHSDFFSNVFESNFITKPRYSGVRRFCSYDTFETALFETLILKLGTLFQTIVSLLHP